MQRLPRLDGNDRDRSRGRQLHRFARRRVHRYPSFEDADEVIDRYGTANTSTEATWPLLLPSDGDTVVNADTGEATTVDLVDAFEGPVTPTLQVLDGEGHLVWTSKTYWSNTSVLDEAATLMRSLNEAVA